MHPSTATIGPDGSDAVKRILGGLTTIANGLAELRTVVTEPGTVRRQPGLGFVRGMRTWP